MSVWVGVGPRPRAVAVDGDVADALAQLGLRVPGAALARWRLAGRHQVRTLYAFEDAGGAWVGLGVHRPLTAYQKIAGACRAQRIGSDAGPAGDAAAPEGVLARVLAALRVRAAADGRAALKCEVWAGERAEAEKWRRAGVRAGFAWIPAPAGAREEPAGGAVPDELVWSPHAPLLRPRPYMRQTTGYTCGPCALLMGLAGGRGGGQLARGREIEVWREATMLDGCGPFGLAMAARHLRAPVRVTVSGLEPLRLDDPGEPAWKGRMRADAERGFLARCRASGVPVEVRRFTARDVAAAVGAGSVALVLVDQYPMHAEPGAHWIAVTRILGGRIALCQDPWTDEPLGETWVDGDGLPLPLESLDRLMAWRRAQACLRLASGRHLPVGGHHLPIARRRENRRWRLRRPGLL